MNTNLVIILILEIIVLGIALKCILNFNAKVNSLNETVVGKNQQLKKMLKTSRELFGLTHEYLELWKKKFMERVNNVAVFLGEITAYWLIHKIFHKDYKHFEAGFKIAKFFW